MDYYQYNFEHTSNPNWGMDRNGGEIVGAGVRHTFPKAHCNSKLKCIDGRVL